MKTIRTLLTVFLLLLLFSFSHANAQGLATLLEQREALYDEWEFYESQNSAFFGGKSKDDLYNIIEVQRQIITKDNEIVEEIKSLNNNNQKALKTEVELTKNELEAANDKIASLKTELESLTELYNETLSDTSSEGSQKNTLFIVVILLAGVILFLLIKLIKPSGNTPSIIQEPNLETSRHDLNLEDHAFRLEKVKKLKEAGLISDQDYDLQKNNILASI